MVLFNALTAVKVSWDSGERSGDVLRAVMTGVLAAEPLATTEYVSVADIDTFRELDRADQSARALLAVKIGSARLIDNILLD